MLRRLTINNYALIDSLDISFPEHLVIITGETGAGKSILLGAMSLLWGGKADLSVLKDKEKNCVVEAEFGSPDNLIIRRVITPQGRSRMFIDDEPAGTDQVKLLSSSLIDIHSQNSQMLLSDKKFQLSVLDYFSDNEKLLIEYHQAYSLYQKKCSELKEMQNIIAEQERNRDYAEFQFNQLNDAKLVSGEIEDLEQEQKRLANAEEIKNNLMQVISLLGNEEFSLDYSLKETESLLKKTSVYLPTIENLASRIASCRVELKDIISDVCGAQEKINISPERLEFIDGRIALIYDLLRKHGKKSVEDLILLRDGLSEQIGREADYKEHSKVLQKECTELDEKCRFLAGELHDRRIEFAPKLSSVLEKSIKGLEMPHAVFQTRVTETESRGRDGSDNVQFYFSANGTGALMELSKCASGGEVSRIMLCIKTLMAQYTGMPTIIFDEIDTGVSGSIADKMGSMIVEMGKNMQVFAITHLPQVASKGFAHFLVFKNFNKQHEAFTGIKEISGRERVLEIARMLSGSQLSEAAIANAEVLLNG